MLCPSCQGAAVDPLALSKGLSGLSGYSTLDGKSPVDPRLIPGEATKVIVTIGQSLITNAVDGLYAAGPKVHNLSLECGGVFQATQPLLGCSYGAAGRPSNYALHLADKLIAANICARAIIAPIGIGGTTVTQWANGGPVNERIGVLSARLAAHGYVADYVLWHQGESDHGVSSSTYTSLLNEVISTFRSKGVAAPFLVALASYNNGATSTAVRNGQLGTVNGSGVFLGPDLDTLGASYRVDNLHFNQAGANAAANLWLQTIQDYENG